MTQSPFEAVKQALSKINALPVTNASVSYHSSGRVLIIGTVEQILSVQPRLEQLQLFVLFSAPTPAAMQFQLAKTTTVIEAEQPYRLSGYLGAFMLHDKTQIFDLVLDMQTAPLINVQIPPVGYYALKHQNLTLNSILDEIDDRVGTFDKPKFFSLDTELCAHTRNGIQGCRQCLDICATEAISSSASAIKVDPYLCQGCGDCTTVCPSGAINYNYPARSDTINNISTVLKVFRQAGGNDAVLLLHDLDDDNFVPPELGGIIPYRLEAIGTAGMDIWLSALALGASQVWIRVNDQHTALSRQAIDEQLQLAQEILQGMSYPAEQIRTVNVIDETVLGFKDIPEIPPAQFAGVDDKRMQIRLAVDHLYQHCPQAVASIGLSSPALFGRVKVDSSHCTLCFACVSTCPVGALASGQKLPQLKFIESACVQCGLCQSACPEQVISLIPEYGYDSVKVREPTVLHEQKPFCCIQCNKAFATKSMIAVIQKKLQDHPMFQGENANKLLLCEDCRVTEQFSKH